MQRASEVSAALIVVGANEWYVVGNPSDIGRLHEAGYIERAWALKMDNGHRPYAVLRKTIYFPITDQATNTEKNQLTQAIAAVTGLSFTDDLHAVTDTYLFRTSAAFWGDLWVDYRDRGALSTEGYYAVYYGVTQPLIQNIKFSRLA